MLSRTVLFFRWVFESLTLNRLPACIDILQLGSIDMVLLGSIDILLLGSIDEDELLRTVSLGRTRGFIVKLMSIWHSGLSIASSVFFSITTAATDEPYHVTSFPPGKNNSYYDANDRNHYASNYPGR